MSPEPSGFGNIGLPEGHAFPRLVYHAPTGIIIAHTRPLKRRLPSERLSMRRVSETRYALIESFPPEVSVSSFALSPTAPFLYFLTETWKEIGDTVGGDWAGLHRFNLDTRQGDMLARPGELALPAPYR